MTNPRHLSKGVFLYMAAALWNLGLVVVAAMYTRVDAILYGWPGSFEAMVFVAISGFLAISFLCRLPQQKQVRGMALIAVALIFQEGFSLYAGRGISIEILAILFLAGGVLIDWRARDKAVS
jgi:hypothetical protein